MCLVLLAMLIKKRRRRDNEALPIQLKRTSDNMGDGQIDPHEIQICKTADGSDWLLGAGSFGNVYKGLRHGVHEVAVKKLVVDTGADTWLRQLAQESAMLKKVSHNRNIVQFYGACLVDQASSMLVMEYMAVCSRASRRHADNAVDKACSEG